jgi:hypothetical protein
MCRKKIKLYLSWILKLSLLKEMKLMFHKLEPVPLRTWNYNRSFVQNIFDKKGFRNDPYYIL